VDSADLRGGFLLVILSAAKNPVGFCWRKSLWILRCAQNDNSVVRDTNGKDAAVEIAHEVSLSVGIGSGDSLGDSLPSFFFIVIKRTTPQKEVANA
jgi:hypothetical protein